VDEQQGRRANSQIRATYWARLRSLSLKIEAAAKRRLATREGWRYQRVQPIIVAIDQYAEAATGYREFFLNKPPNTGKALQGVTP
jgi:hypothetical protein